MSHKSMITGVVVALAFGLAPAKAMSRRPRMDKSMQTSGAFCRIAQPGHRVVRKPKEWAALWRDIGRPAPSADLKKNFAVAVFAGTRESGGFSIEIEDPVSGPDGLVINYSVIPPKGMATMALTQPYAVKLFQATTSTVTVQARQP